MDVASMKTKENLDVVSQRLGSYSFYGVLVIILGAGLYFALRPLTGYFRGETELSYLRHVSRIYHAITTFTLEGMVEAIGVLSAVHHPPLRYLLAIPGVILFGDNEIGVRFVAYCLLVPNFVLLFILGRKLGGNWVALFSSGLYILSGLHHIELLYLFSFITFCYLCIAILLVDYSFRAHDLGKGLKFHFIFLILFIAFLHNTTNIVLMCGFFALHIFYVKNKNNVLWLITRALPWGVLVFGYYLYFLVIVPSVATYFFDGWYDEPFGQLRVMIGRVSMFVINIDSFLENLQFLNAYFIPYIGWPFFVFAICHGLKTHRNLTILFSGFILLWSFFLVHETWRYFLTTCIVLIPFGVAYVKSRVTTVGFKLIMSSFLVLVGVWTYSSTYKEYSVESYPYRLREIAYTGSPPTYNVIEPIHEMSKDMKALLAGGYTYSHNMSESINLYFITEKFYVPHAGYVGKSDLVKMSNNSKECYRVEGTPPTYFVSRDLMCEDQFDVEKQYSTSKLRIFRSLQ
jgi:hypothetical protein